LLEGFITIYYLFGIAYFLDGTPAKELPQREKGTREQLSGAKQTEVLNVKQTKQSQH